MPKTYVENPYCTMSEFTTSQQSSNADLPNTNQTATAGKPKELGKREHLKLKLAKFWAGSHGEDGSVTKTETPNERRHRLRFWRKNKEESPSVEQAPQMPLWTPATDSSSNAESFTIRDYITTDAVSESTVSSISETNTVVHTPFPLVASMENESVSQLSEPKSEEKDPYAAPTTTKSMVETTNPWRRFTPLSTNPTIIPSPAFSDCRQNYTPLTPQNYPGSDSKVASYNSAWKPCTTVPPGEDGMFFVDGQKQSVPSLHFEPRAQFDQGLKELHFQMQPGSYSNNRQSPATEDYLFDVQRNGLSPMQGTASPNAKSISRTWEQIEDELWVARLLKEYCPVKLRKNKRMNYDSEEFSLKQADMTLKALVDQELRDQDKKLIFRPSLSSGKSFFRGVFHFEEDEDILESMEQFILCNDGLIPLYRGDRPALRRHLFRRWQNHDRDRIIICEQLLEKWQEDKSYLNRLKEDRDRRQQRRLYMNDVEGHDDKLPPFSFFVKKLLVRLNGTRGRIGKPPKRGSKLLVLKKEPLFGVPYLEKKKLQAKAWIKDLLLRI